MSDTTNELQAWKMFLKGRIAQERGRHEEAIQVFEQVLALAPGNKHFLNAKANALMTTGRHEEAKLARIAAGYAELAEKHTGAADKPEPWIRGLEELLREAEADPSRITSVVW